MPKSRPLIVSGDRYLSFPASERAAGGALLLRDMETVPPVALRWGHWALFADACPPSLLLERRLLLDCTTDDRLRRLPVLRLRRDYLHGAARRLVAKHPRHTARLHTWLLAHGLSPWVGSSVSWLDPLLDECIVPLVGAFERALHHVTDPAFRSAWLPLIQAMGEDTGYWTGLPASWIAAITLPHGDDETAETYVLLRTVLWRGAVTEWVAKRLLPAPLLGHGDCDYQTTLFHDTHLDLLSLAYSSGRADDAFLMPRLGEVYPLPHRVCCAEELPDLTPYLVQADLAFDSGRGKKQRTLQQAIIHVFLCKMMNNICHIRHLPAVIKTCTEEFPVVKRLFELVIRVALLGNMPLAQRRLGLAARIRVQMDYNDPTFGDRLVRWAIERKFLSLFLLREFFIYTVVADGVVDHYLGRRQEWDDYKRAVAYANSEVCRCSLHHGWVCVCVPHTDRKSVV